MLLQDDSRMLKQMLTTELFQRALTADDEGENQGWYAIHELQARATRDIFETARMYCVSHEPLYRVVGVTILAQLGIESRPYLEETLPIFFQLIDTENDVAVLNAVMVGLGHISPEPRKVKPLLRLKSHPHPDVRFGVAFGLACEDDPSAVAALIELSADPDNATRDWAIFALGSLTELDTPEIREALFTRLTEPDDTSNAPYEALVGLVERHDARAFEQTLRLLESGRMSPLIFESAETLADPRLYPALIKHRDNPNYEDYERRSLESAITACSNELG